MKAVVDSTVVFHLNQQQTKMSLIINRYDINELLITRINYLEILSGASENAKILVRKALKEFPLLEFDKKAVDVANTLAMRYRVSKKNSRAFLIASIAIANKLPLLTENVKDFNYTELNLLPYNIQ